MKRTVKPLKRALLSVLGSFMFTAFAFGEKYNLAVNTADGNCTVFSLQEHPSIIVEDGEFTICCKESKIKLPTNDVLGFSFIKNTTYIASIKDSGITVSVDTPDHLIISGIKASTNIKITDINGRQIQTENISTDSSTKDIYIGNVPTGIYIVSINGVHNFKITRK